MRINDKLIDSIADRIVREIQIDVREKQWKEYIKRTEPLEKDFREDLRKLFDKQRKEVVANIRKTPKALKSEEIIDSWMFGVGVWIEEYATVGMKQMKNIIITFGSRTLSELPTSIEFDADNAKLRSWVETRSTEYATQVTKTSYRDLRDEIVEAVRDNATTKEIIGRVDEKYAGWEKYRVDRIARTETTAASNQGIIEGMEQSQVVNHKEWLSMRDTVVRDQHIMMDGEQRLMGERFSNGLMHPGDPNGFIEEIINCRCSLLPVIKE